MEKILVPVDFSPHTVISCEYAREIAAASGAEIILFHSFFEQIYFSDGGFATGFESGIMLTDELILDFYKQKERQLDDLKDKLLNSRGGASKGPLKVSGIIETGDPQVQILHAVDKLAPDLVIMGSAGLGKKGFLAGSVCKRVMDHTETPVLAIPDIKAFKGLQNILYVTDIEPGDAAVLKRLYDMFRDFHSWIYCLHLNVNGKDRDSQEQMKALSEEESLEEGKYNFHVINCKDPRTSLMDYITVNDIHLIAFIPHKKNFFSIFTRQDLTKEDLFLTGLPILGIL